MVDGVAVEGGGALAAQHHGLVRSAADFVAAEQPPVSIARNVTASKITSLIDHIIDYIADKGITETSHCI